MAIKLSRATGNWSSGSTWETIDATSYVNSESVYPGVGTSYTASTAAVTGAIVATGIGLKLGGKNAGGGTLSVHLAVAGVEVSGTLVVVDLADLPTHSVSEQNGGWFFFKFASPVTLSAATSYAVEIKTSNSNTLYAYASSGTLWSHFISTTTTGAPAAGDDVIIAGEYTGQGTSNSFVVTMDNTNSTTDYGAASTSNATPAIAICSKGTLEYGTTASTAYYLKVSGNVIVYSGGTLNIGTTGTPMPSTSSGVLHFDCAANVDFGLLVRSLGTCNLQGASKTVKAYLNADAAASATSITSNVSTGWKTGDEIGIGSTTRTQTQNEKVTLAVDASGTTITVPALTYAHSGSNGGPNNESTKAELINLTRNVKIRGASASLQSFLWIGAWATIDFDYAEFYWFGSGGNNKHGIDIFTTTGNCNIQYCSLHDFIASNSYGFYLQGGSGSTTSTLVISNNVTYDIHSIHVYLAATTGTYTIDSNWCLKAGSLGYNCFDLRDLGGIITNNVAVGHFVGFSSNGYDVGGTFSGNIAHSNGSGFYLNNIANVTFSGCKAWRNNGIGVGCNNPQGLWTFTDLLLFGNVTSNFGVAVPNGSRSNFGGILKFIRAVWDSESVTYTTTYGFDVGYGVNKVIFEDSLLGFYSNHTTADIAIIGAGYSIIELVNTKLASSVEVSGQATMWAGSMITSQKHDQTAGNHRAWKPEGNLAIETTTVQAGGFSLKMTPISASLKLKSSSFQVAVANGETVTPTVYVYEDASYNGARARLYVKANPAMGISSDTLLDTATSASDAAWEALTGTTAAVTDDGVLEFYVDCDGTAGNLFVDSFSVA